MSLQGCIYFDHFPHYVFYLLKAETRKLTFPDLLVARVLRYDLGFTNQPYPDVTSAKEAASGDTDFLV